MSANESTPRQRLLLGATVCCSVVLGLVMAEILLRCCVGRHPVRAVGTANEPTMNIPDPILGWRLKPGNYRYPGYTKDAPPIIMTLWPNGSRATREPRMEQDRQIVFIGDSFTQGWAISDDETYVWKLQARFPNIEFVNYGTAGYNGVQALLRLQEHLDARPQPPELVVYGFNDDQERRNVAAAEWTALLAISPHREMVRLPYCLLDGHGGLTMYPPAGYPMWPLRERLALVPLLENSAFWIATRHRGQQQRGATELLLERMNLVVRERGSRLLVVQLYAPPELGGHYARYLEAHGIAFVDCRLVGFSGELAVPGEGHPNGLANTQWSECIGRFLDADFVNRTTGTAPTSGIEQARAQE